MKCRLSVPGAAFAACWGFSACGGPQIEQSVTLNSGWNAIYVSVEPESSADELFADWPVWSVSAYNADAFLYTASTDGGLTGEGVVRAPFWIWSREASAANTLKSLQADTVLLCYSTNSTPFSVALRGTPVAPRIAWHVSDDTSNTDFRNMFGVRLSGEVKASDYLAGCPAATKPTLYYISGPNESEPRLRPLATGTGTPLLNDGSVVFSTGTSVSDWSGPLYIMPRAGVDFSEEGMIDEISIRNDGAHEKTVTLVYTDSVDGMERPELLCRESYAEDAVSDWTPLAGELSRTIPTGETWRVALALDRTKLAGTGAKLGGILRIAETGGTKTMAWLPVSAVDAKSAAPWPQGLWVATLKLTKVSYYRKDGDKVDGVGAGGTMPVKVFLAVGQDGSAKLVQRRRYGRCLAGVRRVRQGRLPPQVRIYDRRRVALQSLPPCAPSYVRRKADGLQNPRARRRRHRKLHRQRQAGVVLDRRRGGVQVRRQRRDGVDARRAAFRRREMDLLGRPSRRAGDRRGPLHAQARREGCGNRMTGRVQYQPKTI